METNDYKQKIAIKKRNISCTKLSSLFSRILGIVPKTLIVFSMTITFISHNKKGLGIYLAFFFSIRLSAIS